ncbi:hypothetical protein [Microbacterium sp. ZXX196]|uniref:hypothetical protein n=1 Tax=Microbacterium sp. ZXX196 TaxID=2609291 RepID=UPI0012B88B4C|nr:hypothetical protein [Microbacterium sp. ZXX196]MTE24451.1 hypothetical protein [Microbacterium sp. ZXX196]
MGLFGGMDSSPRGRSIEKIEGNPFAIEQRGNAIASLGEKMSESATVLEVISTRAEGGQGKAIDKLRETIGDSYATLREAGDLYTPVGPVIAAYGVALADVKYALNGTVDECEGLWQTYDSLPGSVDPRGTGGLFQPDEGSPEAQAQAEEDQAKKNAYEAWEAEAEAFDGYYDTWEEAFDTAVSGITDEMAGEIEDGGWRTFFKVFGDVLGWVGLAVGIVALFVGGPVIAIIAAVVSVAALVVAIVQAVDPHNKAGWGGVAWALVDFVPFGKLGRLGRQLPDGAANKIDDLFTGNPLNPTTYTKAFDELAEGAKPFTFNGWGGSFVKALTGNTPDGWTKTIDDYTALDVGDAGFLRSLGKGFVHGAKMTPGILLETTTTVADNAVSWWGRVEKVTQGESPKSQYPWLNFL